MYVCMYVYGRRSGAWNNASQDNDAADKKKNRSIDQKVNHILYIYIHTYIHTYIEHRKQINKHTCTGLYKSVSWAKRKWKDYAR